MPRKTTPASAEAHSRSHEMCVRIHWPQGLRPHLCLKFQNHGYRYVLKEYKALVQSVFRLALKPFKSMEKVHFAASNKLIAVDMVEVNPILDEKNQTGILASELILAALGKVVY